jgi:hypothetical protein
MEPTDPTPSAADEPLHGAPIRFVDEMTVSEAVQPAPAIHYVPPTYNGTIVILAWIRAAMI